MKARGAADFVTASLPIRPRSSTSSPIAATRHPSSSPGIEFFTLVRRMTVDAFYTSEIGIKDIDYRGNSPMASYPAPTESIAVRAGREVR